jgi:ATP-dependent helicase HepA
LLKPSGSDLVQSRLHESRVPLRSCAFSMERPTAGQRWSSDSEPEMGLGTIVKVEFGRVEVHFPAADERRVYAIETAPLRRVRFGAGDKIKTRAGAEVAVESVDERSGLLVYRTSGGLVPEQELSDAISFSKA